MPLLLSSTDKNLDLRRPGVRPIILFTVNGSPLAPATRPLAPGSLCSKLLAFFIARHGTKRGLQSTTELQANFATNATTAVDRKKKKERGVSHRETSVTDDGCSALVSPRFSEALLRFHSTNRLFIVISAAFPQRKGCVALL